MVLLPFQEKAYKLKNNHFYLTASSPKNLHRLGSHLKNDRCDNFKS